MKAKDLKGISNPLSIACTRLLKSPAFYSILIIFISILVLNVKYPMVGYDYSYFVPRLLDSHLFYLKNGLEIHWWTPSFGAGLPSYPNPQQIQFSLPQLLLFITNPWISINISIIVFVGIGFFSTFFLFKRLSFPKDQAILGATLFSTAGFFIEHLSVGHLGYIAFPLLPLVILLLINDKLPIPAAAIGIAFTFFILIHTAGFYVLVIFMFSVPISLLLIYILSNKIKPHYLRLFSISLIGLVTGILISSSKLTAVWSHLRYFPRYVEDVYNVNIFKSIMGFLSQLFLTPIAVFFKGLNLEKFFQDLVGTGTGMELWEFDIGLSPVILGLLLSSCLLLKNLRFSRKKQTAPPIQNANLTTDKSRNNGNGSFLCKFFSGNNKKGVHKIVLLCLGILLCWISFELCIAKGIFYKYLKNIAFMKSLHVNVRFVSIFILPIVVLSMYIYTRLKERIRIRPLGKVNVSLFLSLIAIVFYTQYINIPIDHGNLAFNITQSQRDWANIRRSPGDFEIKYILEIRDTKVFLLKSSSFLIIEPIFGYNLENHLPKTEMGAVTKNDGHYYNITHPASLVFPEENNLSKFQRISLADTENFKKFVTYQNPGWKLSNMQKISNHISTYTIIAVFLMLLFYLSRYILKAAAPPTQKGRGKRPRNEKKEKSEVK